ncbi:MAG: tetratricopeptide repeat protein [Planctomycetia bacterium]|nr:tetratricopeptide repeat protein [Planctomycetia bacterium]
MARKRLNFRFLLILLVTLSILGGVGYGVWGFNKSRIVDSFYDRGMATYEAGDKIGAMELFGKYLAGGKDTEKRAKVLRLMAFFHADELETIGVGSASKLEFIQRVIQNALELHPRDPELKEAMAKAYGKMRKYTQASRLFDELYSEFPEQPDFLLYAAENQIAGNQLNEAGMLLAKLVEQHPTYLPGYLCYAKYHESNLGQADVAENILDSMVEANLQSATAHAKRAIFRMNHANPEGAAEDIAFAMDLEPEAVDTLISAGMYAIYEKKFGEARELLERALAADASRLGEISKLQIRLADAEKKPEEVVDLLRREIDAKDDLSLRLQLFERLIAMQKTDEAKKELEHLRRLKMPAEVVGFFESTVDILEKKWKDASQKLEHARAAMGMHPEMLAFIDRQLALCYGELGQTDKQIDAFRRAVENASDAELVPVYTAYIVVLNKAGKTEQLEEVVRDLMIKIGEAKFMEVPQLRAIRIALLTQKEAMLPKEKQNWEAINNLLQSNDMADDPENILLSVRMLIKQGKIAESRDLLRQAMNRNPETLAFASYLALLEAQEKNFQEALQIIDTAIEKKTVPGMFLTKIRILFLMDKEKAGVELEKMEKQIASFSPIAQATILKQIASAWLHFGELEKAKTLFDQIVKLEPENIGIKVQMFDLARKANDSRGMDLQMGQIRQLAGNNSAESLYCQAAKKIWQFTQKKVSAQELDAAMELLERAENTRPSWVNIPRAQAEIALLKNDYSAAIDALYRVDQTGTLSPQQLDLLIRLLYREERDGEVKQLIENKRNANLATDAAMMSVEALANQGEGDEALRRAEEIIDPNDPKDSLWKGQIALRSKNYKEAEEAFLQVTEMSPENPNGWLSLLQVLKLQEKEVPEEVFISKIQQAVPAEKLPLCLGKAYQLFGKAKESEAAFRQALALEPNDLEVLYAISQFYMCTSHPELAIPHLRKMNELIGVNRNLSVDMRNLQLSWTRRSLAQIYGKSADFDKQQQALQLVDENLRQQPDSIDDLKVKATLLAARNNPTDNQAAIELLENIPALSPKERFLLAKLYDIQSSGYDSRIMWEKCQAQMRDLIHTNDTNVEYLRSFVEMMLQHKSPAVEIQPYLERLQALAPHDSESQLLIAQALAAAGNQEEAEKILRQIAAVPITEENEPVLKKVAYHLERLGRYTVAMELWERLVTFQPKNLLQQLPSLAREEGIMPTLDKLERRIQDLDSTDILDVIPTIFRVSKRVGTKEETLRAEKIASVAVQEKKDSIEYQLFMGRFLESQGKTQQAIKQYRDMLENTSLTRVQKAFIENNLAYVLAVSDTDISQAINLVEQAIKVLGNGPDLLDTQATIYLKTGERSRIDQAIHDLKRAIVAKQEPLYYFHLATAYLKRENRNSAKIAFDMAKRLDPNLAQNIPKPEMKDYNTIVTPLGQ